MFKKNFMHAATMLAALAGLLLGGRGTAAFAAADTLPEPSSPGDAGTDTRTLQSVATLAERRHFAIYQHYRAVFDAPSAKARQAVQGTAEIDLRDATLFSGNAHPGPAVAACSRRMLMLSD